MAAIVSTIEISRSPDEVFAYAVEPANLADWQDNVVSAQPADDAPLDVGSRIMTVRRLGKREQPMTMEMTGYDPPRGWTMKGVDGPIRPLVEVTIEPISEGSASRVTIALDFEGRGVGKLLVPLFVRPETKRGLPRNLELLKDRVETLA
ncbi:MAG TPA: SRPBCC family protein [Acidimicrobiia bacterium]|jgi:uncharacterized protein YndB with AHSA1/START domain|nr:SRPBCC family protein [Acidimicrobiia bacterium]